MENLSGGKSVGKNIQRMLCFLAGEIFSIRDGCVKCILFSAPEWGKGWGEVYLYILMWKQWNTKRKNIYSGNSCGMR